MPKLIRLKASESETRHILIQVAEGPSVKVGITDQIIDQLDKQLDRMVRNEIVENSKTLVQSFKELSLLEIKPAKATAEFGLTFTASGDIFLVKGSAEATYKLSIEWSFA